MKQRRFTEEQKAFALREADSGVPISEILRKLGDIRGDVLSVEEEVPRIGRYRT